MKKVLLLTLLVCGTSYCLFSQTKDSKWGIETDILWPFFPGATRTHITFKTWQRGHLRGDAYVGLNIDFPQNRPTEGRFADYSIASGYRQYFLKGLHLEYSQTTGMGVLQNHVSTGKNYQSFDWLITGYLGYKFSLAKGKCYVLPQFGVAGVVYKSNPWPIYKTGDLTELEGERPFMLGSLRFGIQL